MSGESPIHPGPVDGTTRGLRAPGSLWRSPSDDAVPRVLRVDPPHHARGVFRDAPVIVSFSRPADPRTVSPETFVVLDEHGGVPGGVWTSLDGRVAVWTPARLLSPGTLHCVRLAGVRDLGGRPLTVHESVFVPGDLALNDLGP